MRVHAWVYKSLREQEEAKTSSLTCIHLSLQQLTRIYDPVTRVCITTLWCCVVFMLSSFNLFIVYHYSFFFYRLLMCFIDLCALFRYICYFIFLKVHYCKFFVTYIWFHLADKYIPNWYDSTLHLCKLLDYLLIIWLKDSFQPSKTNINFFQK